MPDRDVRSAASGAVVHPAGGLQAGSGFTIGRFYPTEHACLGLQFKVAIGLVLKFEVR
jgi:hypothetical protein